MGKYHEPVLLHTVCNALQVHPGSKYLDATLGGGGHAGQIVSLGGLVLGIDQDPDAISQSPDIVGLTKVRGSFSHLEEIARKYKWTDIAGVLFDLGVSSHQLDTPSRGFSFQSTGPLDMRMDPDLSITAADLVNSLSKKQLIQVLLDFGEEKTARKVADLIIANRPFSTTNDLARLLIHPQVRRRVFQAFRIAVNDEMGELVKALPQALTILASGGKMLVISFHSLEDRIVKDQFYSWQRSGLGVISSPDPIIPGPDEIAANPRSKSSKLRIFIKK